MKTSCFSSASELKKATNTEDMPPWQTCRDTLCLTPQFNNGVARLKSQKKGVPLHPPKTCNLVHPSSVSTPSKCVISRRNRRVKASDPDALPSMARDAFSPQPPWPRPGRCSNPPSSWRRFWCAALGTASRAIPAPILTAPRTAAPIPGWVSQNHRPDGVRVLHHLP